MVLMGRFPATLFMNTVAAVLRTRMAGRFQLTPPTHHPTVRIIDRCHLRLRVPPMNNISPKDLRRAADLLEQIDAAQAELEAILSGQPAKGKPGRKPGGAKAVGTGPKPKAKKKTGKKRSAAVRAKMAESQKKRWAAKKKAEPEPKAKSAKKKAKGTMSDAGRARIAAAQKKRWAAKRKADKAAAK
jgi:hypothetical protein